MEESKLIAEYREFSERRNELRGFRKIINVMSESFSLQVTIYLQKLGINKRYKSNSNFGKFIINVGCGDFIIENQVNCDLFPTFGGIIRILLGREKVNKHAYVNILYRDPNLENSAKGVVFSHVLEHIPPHLTEVALKNLYHMLADNGTLRISVPSVESYFSKRDVPKDQGFEDNIIALNNLVYGWGHRFMYSVDILQALLANAGFSKIEICSSGEGKLGDTDVPRRHKETIYLTAKKLKMAVDAQEGH